MGGGTGFCTLGVVEAIRPENVTLIDQSPHQLAKAKAKPQLKGVTILEVRRGALWGALWGAFCGALGWQLCACWAPWLSGPVV